ncbi:hypothetical protein [uncultured Reyranella sp.]|jgi:hypothetical protein|uniref:hypothetical protein n=1 Tax=uncultured Reyranella sp. TaxID=735512 RepID=UPI00259CF725|nr:hypothetical protein [uncultured Reyranella sp.]
MLKRLVCLAVLLSITAASTASARDELVSARLPDGKDIPYVLTIGGGTPRYGVILMPGGSGNLDPRLIDGKLTLSLAGNFLIRSRELFAEGPFVAASTDATTTTDRILAIVRDLQRRYGSIPVYVIGTSRSTDSTMTLSPALDGMVAGFVHTSSMNRIASFDTRTFKSRHLVVYHAMDACRVTKPSASASARSNGAETIEVTGGTSTGDDCEARAYHGYNGIERATIDKIKAWIAKS